MNTESSISKEIPFSIIMPVRITDINYGMHLGHVATVGIFHNARVLFMKSQGFDEMNIDGLGLIIVNSHYSFKNEAFFNALLKINVGIGEYSKLKFNFTYEAVNQETDMKIVNGKEEFVFINYSTKKIAKIPEKFLEFCEKNQLSCESRNLI